MSVDLVSITVKTIGYLYVKMNRNSSKSIKIYVIIKVPEHFKVLSIVKMYFWSNEGVILNI